MPILNWLTRDDDVKAVQKVPYRLLEEVPELSYGDKDAGNMLIQGDNLEALKSLLPFYAGQVKCIYIDPPYNTRSAFNTYDDNLEHTKWLAMMWPRLELLRDLLSEDGSIWVSIDDNEAHYLKVIMDEVFGRSNFLSDIIWRSSDAANNDAKTFSVDHNHTLVYSKNNGWLPYELPRTAEQNKHYKNPDDDPRGPWFAGNVSSPKPRENLTYEVISPEGNIIQPPSNGWRWKEETLNKMIKTGEVRFLDNGTRLQKRTYLADQKGLSASTLWHDLDDTGHNRQAKYEQKKLWPEIITSKLFDTPKPEKLLRKILSIATQKGDLVLDSFIGSATTSAVAQKMERRHIGIEMGEQALTFSQPRLQKVIDGEQGGISKAVNWQGGGGFRFYRLGEKAFDEDGRICADIRFPVLAAHVWFSETSTPWNGAEDSPAIGIHDGVAYALLYNGILGDKRPQGGNVLTGRTLQIIRDEIQKIEKDFIGQVIVYGESSRMGDARLKAENIIFKQTPYDVKAR